MNPRTRWVVTIFACAGMAFLAASTATAHDPVTGRATGVLSDGGYERMRQLAHDLDGRAEHASNQADHGGSWFYRNDRVFRRAVANFARRAANFHDRMDAYRTAPWQVDDELRGLLNDARAVQARLQRSRNVDDHTAQDWSETVDLLNEMIRVYRSDMANGPVDRGEYARPGAPRGNDPYEAGGSPRRGYNAQQMGSLVHELAERSTRLMDAVNQLSGRYSGRASQGESVRAIQHFTEQANAFHERYESGLSPEDVRGNVAHLWDDAREADQRFRQANVQELEGEWTGMMQLLSRIRSASGY